LPGAGTTKDVIFRDVAARVLNKYFNDNFPDYPAFTDLLRPMTKDNFDVMIKNALTKIIKPTQPNRDGEAILSGLGLWNGTRIDTQNSKYADNIRKKLIAKGKGKVLNRDEIIYAHYAPHNLWYSVDFKIDHQLQFLVLASMVFTGDIEITWSSSRTLTASSIDDLQLFSDEGMFSYQNVKEPKGIPTKHLKTLFECLRLPDLTTEIEKPETAVKIVTEAKKMVEKTVEVRATLTSGLKCKSTNLLKPEEEGEYKTRLDALSRLLDKIQSYNTYGKLKSFTYTSDVLNDTFQAYELCHKVENLNALAKKYEKLINYLSQALSYVIESEQPLFNDMNGAINELPSKLTSGKESEIKKYDRYARYYHDYYLKCRLSPNDARAKERILGSDKKRICDIIKDSEFITATDYQNWVNIITSLKEADPSITLQKVKEESYQDFNPREFYGKPNYKITELEEQLEEILDKWVVAMRSIFKDPSVKSNIDLLKAGEKQMVEAFRDEKIELTIDNAQPLRNLISTLSKGIDKVEISMDDFKKQLNRPVTPNEAIEILTAYIDSLCIGKERNKVRIIIK
jgi:soluble cytochrome b562